MREAAANLEFELAAHAARPAQRAQGAWPPPTCAGGAGAAELRAPARDPRALTRGGARGRGRNARAGRCRRRSAARLRGRSRRGQDHLHPGDRARARRRRPGDQPDLRAGAPVPGPARARCSTWTAIACGRPTRRRTWTGRACCRRATPSWSSGPSGPARGCPPPARRFRLHHLPDPERRGLEVALMRLALDTATDRASVALGYVGDRRVERESAGARRHAAALLPMIDAAARARPASRSMTSARVVLSDGPGSFTGLRVGAAVAKALVQARGLPLWIAPSLLVRAPRVPPGPARWSLAVADALRGELYAAAYRFDAAGVRSDARAVGPPARGARVAGPCRRTSSWVSAPEPRPAAAGALVGRPSSGRRPAAPHARLLLDLVGRPGGARESRRRSRAGSRCTAGRPKRRHAGRRRMDAPYRIRSAVRG